MTRFSAETCERIKCYVYLYIDPRDGKVFYVGKGCGTRIFDHLDEDPNFDESRKTTMITAIRRAGMEPRLEILRHGLTESEARLVEASAIDLLKGRKLTNAVSGHGSNETGRVPVKELIERYDAPKAMIKDPGVIFIVNQLYYPGMGDTELYDATRGVWVVGARRHDAKYAFAVVYGVVKEVYLIKQWHIAGKTLKRGRDPEHRGKWEFTGLKAPQEIREKYVGKRVLKDRPRGAANPVIYTPV